MALAREQSLPIVGLKGLDRSQPLAPRGFTRSLLNVFVRDGKVTGRGGVTFDATFSAAMAENINQLAPFLDTDSDLTTTLLRIGATTVEKSTDAAAWSDITGTALNGAATDRTQYTMFRDKLYFTNEGQDKPRSYSGSGNTTELAAGSVPFAKAIMSYRGFLFLINVSDDGTTFFPRRARYSPDPDNDWTLCDGNELNFHETQGAALFGKVFGRTAVIGKEDAIIYLRWIGGPVRFAQELAKGAPGTLAPLTAQPIAFGQGAEAKGVVYLGTDYELWLVTDNAVTALPPNVNDILQNELHKPLAGNCRSAVVTSEETYSLFYPRDNTGNWGRITFNYRTGEFSHSQYASHPWDAVATVRWTKEDAESLIGAVDTRTYTIDTTSKGDDTSATAETAVTRRYDIDWFRYSNVDEGRIVSEQSQFTGATLIFDANSYTKCAVSVAKDHQEVFRFRKIYDLRKVHKDDEHVAVRYDVGPIPGEWWKIRIEFIPSTTVNPTLDAAFAHFLPSEKRDVRRTAGVVKEA